jgi:putative membrane protein
MSPHQTSRLSAVSIGIGVAFLVAASAAAAQGTGGTTSSGSSMSAGGASLAAGDKTFVKQFGSRMVEDHSKANDELKQIASSKGITLPTDLDAKHKSKMDKMQKLSGAQFDRAYMDDMVADHKEDVADFKKQASSGKDSDLKAFASKTLPTLEDHLKMAQSTDAAVKASKSASR